MAIDELNCVISIQEIMAILPHRYPMLLVDEVREIVLGESIIAIRNVMKDDPLVKGHFNIMPGLMIAEGAAQSAGILLTKTLSAQKASGFLLGVNIDKIRRPVAPGEQLIYTASFLNKPSSRIVKFECSAFVGKEPVITNFEIKLCCARR